MSVIEVTAVAFAVMYLVLVIRENILAWPAALVSTVLSLVVFVGARLYMESALQVFYAAMAIYGWQQWMRGGERKEGVAITMWTLRTHVVVIASILALTAVFGALLTAKTDAALPYLDSFTTVAALFTTYMVAKKVLENWIYWFVIDAVSVYLYVSRELFVFAALFVGYLVLIVIGYQVWVREWRNGRPSREAAAGVG